MQLLSKWRDLMQCENNWNKSLYASTGATFFFHNILAIMKFSSFDNNMNKFESCTPHIRAIRLIGFN